jgi:hypothetical protein
MSNTASSLAEWRVDAISGSRLAVTVKPQ